MAGVAQSAVLRSRRLHPVCAVRVCVRWYVHISDCAVWVCLPEENHSRSFCLEVVFSVVCALRVNLRAFTT